MQTQLSRMSQKKTAAEAALSTSQAEVADLQATCTQVEAEADALRTSLEQEQQKYHVLNRELSQANLRITSLEAELAELEQRNKSSEVALRAQQSEAQKLRVMTTLQTAAIRTNSQRAQATMRELRREVEAARKAQSRGLSTDFGTKVGSIVSRRSSFVSAQSWDVTCRGCLLVQMKQVADRFEEQVKVQRDEVAVLEMEEAQVPVSAERHRIHISFTFLRMHFQAKILQKLQNYANREKEQRPALHALYDALNGTDWFSNANVDESADPDIALIMPETPATPRGSLLPSTAADVVAASIGRSPRLRIDTSAPTQRSRTGSTSSIGSNSRGSSPSRSRVNTASSFDRSRAGSGVSISTISTTSSPRNVVVSKQWCSDAPLREWEGVVMDDDGNIVELRLGRNNLRGQLPTQVSVAPSN